MSDHTKGQMATIEHSWSDTGLYVDGNKIALISIESEATEENQDQLEQVASANARRLAACWNMFHDIETEVIEIMPAFVEFQQSYEQTLHETLCELAAARALLREVSDFGLYIEPNGRMSNEGEELTSKIYDHLDACDTLGSGHG